MHVLIERNDDIRNEILVEEVNGKKEKKYILEGICIQAEVKNRNGRIYPKKLIAPEIDRFIREDLALGRAVGHLNHPATDPRNDYKEVSHKFTKLVESGNNWIGTAVVTTGTPNGKIVAGLMDEGVNMGISTRALGKTKLFEEKGSKVAVVQSFRLISPGDIVSDPSAPDAYLTNLMENKEWVWQDGMLVEREVEVKKEINEAARTGKLDQAKMVELFEKFVAMTTSKPEDSINEAKELDKDGNEINKATFQTAQGMSMFRELLNKQKVEHRLDTSGKGWVITWVNKKK